MNIQAVKHLDCTEEEIDEYLKIFKYSVKRGRYKISDKNRDKNNEFIKKYSLSAKKIKKMLLELDVVNFAYVVDNKKDISERLYIFEKDYELSYWGESEIVPVYIKINMIEEVDFSVVVSFHELEKDIRLPFNNRVIKVEK